MVRVEWQYSQFKNIARSSHFIPGPYFIHTQSAVRSPQSAVHNPQSVVRSPQSVVRSPWSTVHSPQFAADLKRSTWLRCVRIMLQGYNKGILISEKTFILFLSKRLGHDTGKLWIAVGVTFPPETARLDSFTRRRPPSCLHCATSTFTLPSRHSYIWSVFNFCFYRIQKSKNDFHFGFHHHGYCFPQFRYTWIALSSLNF